MKDDVAHDPRNPEPGTLINRPGGKDLYAGLKIDYKGPDVTPAMFKKVCMYIVSCVFLFYFILFYFILFYCKENKTKQNKRHQNDNNNNKKSNK